MLRLLFILLSVSWLGLAVACGDESDSSSESSSSSSTTSPTSTSCSSSWRCYNGDCECTSGPNSGDDCLSTSHCDDYCACP